MTVQVTGCAHSATLWLSVALSRCGVPATHETRFSFRHDPLPDRPAIDVGWPAVPFVTDAVRLVRDPLAVVRSIWSAPSRFLFNDRPADAFVRQHRPDIFDLDGLDRVVRYVATWCPPYTVTVRAEDGAHTVRAVAALAGITIDRDLAADVCAELGTEIHTHVSHRRDSDVTWQSIRSTPDGDALADLAAGWGYL